KYGIEVSKAGFRVVNVATGAIEAGADAMSFMQAHPDVLAALKGVGEGHRQEGGGAPWKEMKTPALNGPAKVLRWGRPHRSPPPTTPATPTGGARPTTTRPRAARTPASCGRRG